jgi:hypothetical protein
LGAWVLLTSSASAAPSAPTDESRALAAFRRAEFRIVAKQEELPDEVKAAFSSYVKGEVVADPGRKWQATDVVSEPPLARRRLVLAGVGKNLAFLAYEHGGVGKHVHVILLTLASDAKQASLAYGCSGPPIVPVNLDGIRAAVRLKTCAPVAGVQEDPS